MSIAATRGEPSLHDDSDGGGGRQQAQQQQQQRGLRFSSSYSSSDEEDEVPVRVFGFIKPVPQLDLASAALGTSPLDGYFDNDRRPESPSSARVNLAALNDNNNRLEDSYVRSDEDSSVYGTEPPSSARDSVDGGGSSARNTARTYSGGSSGRRRSGSHSAKPAALTALSLSVIDENYVAAQAVESTTADPDTNKHATSAATPNQTTTTTTDTRRDTKANSTGTATSDDTLATDGETPPASPALNYVPHRHQHTTPPSSPTTFTAPKGVSGLGVSKRESSMSTRSGLSLDLPVRASRDNDSASERSYGALSPRSFDGESAETVDARISLPPSATTPSASMVGYLMKRGGRWPHLWQRRFCVLTASVLLYYKSEDAKSASGAVDLRSRDVFRSGRKGKDGYCFDIRDAVGDDGRVYSFFSATEEGRELWYKAIKEECSQSDRKSSVASSYARLEEYVDLRVTGSGDEAAVGVSPRTVSESVLTGVLRRRTPTHSGEFSRDSSDGMPRYKGTRRPPAHSASNISDWGGASSGEITSHPRAHTVATYTPTSPRGQRPALAAASTEGVNQPSGSIHSNAMLNANQPPTDPAPNNALSVSETSPVTRGRPHASHSRLVRSPRQRRSMDRDRSASASDGDRGSEFKCGRGGSADTSESDDDDYSERNEKHAELVTNAMTAPMVGADVETATTVSMNTPPRTRVHTGTPEPRHLWKFGEEIQHARPLSAEAVVELEARLHYLLSGGQRRVSILRTPRDQGREYEGGKHAGVEIHDDVGLGVSHLQPHTAHGASESESFTSHSPPSPAVPASTATSAAVAVPERSRDVVITPPPGEGGAGGQQGSWPPFSSSVSSSVVSNTVSGLTPPRGDDVTMLFPSSPIELVALEELVSEVPRVGEDYELLTFFQGLDSVSTELPDTPLPPFNITSNTLVDAQAYIKCKRPSDLQSEDEVRVRLRHVSVANVPGCAREIGSELRECYKHGLCDEYRHYMWVAAACTSPPLSPTETYTDSLRETFGLNHTDTLELPTTHEHFPDFGAKVDDVAWALCLTHAGEHALRRVLCVLASEFPQLVYCPMVVSVVGVLLAFLFTEDLVFAATRDMIERSYDNRYYVSPTVGDFAILVENFAALVRARKPMHRTMTRVGVSAHSIANAWFATIFIGALPLPIALRVVDWFVLDGACVLLAVGLAVLDVLSGRLTEAQTADEFAHILNRGMLTIRGDTLMSAAAACSLSPRALAQLDATHREALSSIDTSFAPPVTVFYMPHFSVAPTSITRDRLAKVWAWLPDRQRLTDGVRVFSSTVHGNSLTTLVERCSEYRSALILIETVDGSKFGAYVDDTVRVSSRPFGTSDSFVFQAAPTAVCYGWNHTSNDTFCRVTREEGLVVGGGESGPAIRIDSNFTIHTSACETFSSPPLTSSAGTYGAIVVEVYTPSI